MAHNQQPPKSKKVKLHDQIATECNTFVYKPPTPNKHKSVTVYISEHDSDARPRFQLVKYGVEAPLKCPYGISDALDEDKKDATRKSLDISIDNPEFKKSLMALDERNKQVAVENCEKWFHKKLSQEHINFMYQSLIREEKAKPGASLKGYNPTLRTKVQIDPTKPRCTQFYVVTTGSDGKLQYRKVDHTAVGKGSRIIPIVEVASLWFTSSQFGMTLECTDVIIYPAGERNEFDFNLGDTEAVPMEVEEQDNQQDVQGQVQVQGQAGNLQSPTRQSAQTVQFIPPRSPHNGDVIL